MGNKGQDPAQKAREYAFLLLKFRARSAKELAERLKRKGFEPAVVREVIAFLQERRFIDDAAFARGWIEARLARPYGFVRIRQELEQKGIAPEIIARLIEEKKQEFSEEDAVRSLIRAKMKRLAGIEPQKARQRIYGYLIRRGFSPDIIIETFQDQ